MSSQKGVVWGTDPNQSQDRVSNGSENLLLWEGFDHIPVQNIDSVVEEPGFGLVCACCQRVWESGTSHLFPIRKLLSLPPFVFSPVLAATRCFPPVGWLGSRAQLYGPAQGLRLTERLLWMGNAREAGGIVCICLSPAKIEPLRGHCSFYFVGYLECQPCYYKWL